MSLTMTAGGLDVGDDDPCSLYAEPQNGRAVLGLGDGVEIALAPSHVEALHVDVPRVRAALHQYARDGETIERATEAAERARDAVADVPELVLAAEQAGEELLAGRLRRAGQRAAEAAQAITGAVDALELAELHAKDAGEDLAAVLADARKLRPAR